jgi:hypothetical protein
MVLLTLFFALKTDIVDFSAEKILGGNFQILGENFPPEMPRINTAFWTLKSGGDRSPPLQKVGGPVPPVPPGNYAYECQSLQMNNFLTTDEIFYRILHAFKIRNGVDKSNDDCSHFLARPKIVDYPLHRRFSSRRAGNDCIPIRIQCHLIQH